MANSCCTVFLKVVFILFNIVYLLTGLGVAITGVGLLVAKIPTEVVTGTSNAVLPSVVIVCGVIIFVLAILGIIGAGADVWQLVLLYSVSMTVLVLLQAAAIGVLIFYRKGLQGRIDDQMIEYMKDYSDDDRSSQIMIDAVQAALECCGLNSPADWVKYNPSYVLSHANLPDSCECSSYDDDCFEGTYGTGIWTKGCNETIYKVVHKNNVLIGGVSLLLASSQVLFSCVGFCLFGCILRDRRNKYRRITTVDDTDTGGVNINISNSSCNTLSQMPYGMPYSQAPPAYVPLQEQCKDIP